MVEFEKATDEVLSTTFTGTFQCYLINYLSFKRDTDKAGFFDFVKQGLADLINL